MTLGERRDGYSYFVDDAAPGILGRVDGIAEIAADAANGIAARGEPCESERPSARAERTGLAAMECLLKGKERMPASFAPTFAKIKAAMSAPRLSPVLAAGGHVRQHRRLNRI